MSEPSSSASAAAELAQLEQEVTAQANLVRQLKDAKGDKTAIVDAVQKLKDLKAKLADATPKEEKKKGFDRDGLDDLLTRRAFFIKAFEIYGGVAGLYDYGPIGCAVKANLLAEWRKHFVLEDNMLEIDCTSLTPTPVLKASGHVERFCDIMVKDAKTGDCHRADHLLEDVMKQIIEESTKKGDHVLADECKKICAQADSYEPHELDAFFQRFNVKAPGTKNAITPAEPFNMMFPTTIGPTGQIPGFLRPETAQGIFVNFSRLYEFNNRKLPMPVAQIGNAFRNEIAPRAGVLRVREFTMAEIEHFVDPGNKSHKKFSEYKDLALNLFPRGDQLDGKNPTPTKIGEAVAVGTVANETLGYYLARIHLFMMKIGVDPQRIRFRQHLKNEMAHYACDCWDCELHTSYGWIECVGCADRAAYDLHQHSQATRLNLVASEQLETPIIIDCFEPVFDAALMGKTFKKDLALVLAHYKGAPEAVVADLEKKLESGAAVIEITGEDKVTKQFTITKDMVKGFKRYQDKKFERTFQPSVIEPSFGIGRIIYCLLEHSYRVRENDEKRNWLALAPLIAPVKCSVLPLSNKSSDLERFEPFLTQLERGLTQNGVSFKRDDSSVAIGRRYARTDEIAIPFGLTVDFETLKDNTATLRERNSTSQIRTNLSELPVLVAKLCNGEVLWDDLVQKYGLVPPVASKDE